MVKNSLGIIGILFGLFCYLIASSSVLVSHEAAIVIATTLGMAFLWISEGLPIYITALIPLAIFPMTGVMSMKEVSPYYMDQIIFLFIGGFIVAYAIENCGLHKRIAQNIIRLFGKSQQRLLFGFMLASAFLSMWMMNTATVTMLLPVAISVLKQFSTHTKKLSTPLLLGIAYASSIGGMATIVGTAPNAIIVKTYEDSFPDAEPLTFIRWMMIALPLAIILFVVCYQTLRVLYLKGEGKKSLKSTSFEELGPWSLQEKVVGSVFALMCLLWLTIKPIDFGAYTMPGWSELPIFSHPEYIKESTVAIFISILLFVIPMPINKQFIHWRDLQRIPIGIVFLFGAGFALVAGFKSSGVDILLKNELQDIAGTVAPILMVLLLCYIMTFLTELTSNTTSTNLFAIILIAIAGATPDVDPLFYMLPVTFCASCAFMLPVATPPNTIVYGSEKIDIKDMIKTGLVLNIISAIIIGLYGSLVF